MKRLLHRVFSHAQFGGDLSLCWSSAFADEEFLQPVEQRRIARRSIFRLQATDHLLQHRQRPVPLVKPVSAPGFRQFKIGDVRLEQFLQRNMRTGLVPLNSSRAMLLASEKTFERHKQIRTQTSLLAPHRVQISVFEKTREKVLDQILSLFSCKALPTDKCIERSPISSARSEEHTSELQSLRHLVCRLL